MADPAPEAIAACMDGARRMLEALGYGVTGMGDPDLTRAVARALAQRDAARLDGIAQAYDNGYRRAEEQIGAENERLRERAAALDRDLREALATLANERGEGAPPCEGWTSRPRGATVRWVYTDTRPGRVLDAYPRRQPGASAIEWHWWDREIDRDGEVTATHAEGTAPTAREAIRGASDSLTPPTPKPTEPK